MQIDTPFGPGRLAMPSGPHYVFVDVKGAMVNRVPTNFSLRIEDYGDGFEPQRDREGSRSAYHALHARRADSFQDLSEAGRRRILDAMIPFVNDFMRQNPYLRDEAGEARKQADIEKLETEIAELEGKLAAKRDELAHVVGG